MRVNSGTGKFKKFLFMGSVILITLPSAIWLFHSMLNSFQAKTAQALTIERVEFIFDKIYSVDLQSELQCSINKYVTQSANFLVFDQQKLYKVLKDRFKIIKSFDCRLDDKSTLVVKIEGQAPFCFVNKKQVLGELDILFPVELFKDFDCASLPNINVEYTQQNINQDVLSRDLCEFVRKITNFHWQNFDINYVKPSEIRLCPKNTSFRCILLTRNKTFFDCDIINKALQLSQRVAHDKQIQKKLKYTNKKILKLDLRFKSSIVARTESEVKKGEYEEKIVQ